MFYLIDSTKRYDQGPVIAAEKRSPEGGLSHDGMRLAGLLAGAARHADGRARSLSSDWRFLSL